MSEHRRTGGLIGRLGRRNGGARAATPAHPLPAGPAPARGAAPANPFAGRPAAEDEGATPAAEPTPEAEDTRALHDDEVEALIRERVDERVRAALAEDTPADGNAPVAPAGDEPPPERPRLAGPLEAFLRHPFLTLLPLILLVGGAVYLGTERDAVYTSKARITVGRGDLPAFYLEQAMTGNQALAASYARAIAAPPVTLAAAEKAGIDPQDAYEDLSASHVAGSTLIEVEGEGTSERASVDLANAGSVALIDYIDEVSRSNESKDLLKSYREAQIEVRRAQLRVQRLLKGNGAPGGRRGRQLNQAQLDEDTARLRATDLANRYRSISLDGSSTSRLRVIAPAAEAESDRRDMLEQLIIVGVVAGLVLGLGLALLRSNWQLLRTLRRRA